MNKPSSHTTRGILITDFDGTITSCDYFELVRRRWPLTPDPWDQTLAGHLPMVEAIRRIFAGARGTAEEFLALSDQTGVGPEIGEAFAALMSAGWQVVVASAGCDYYIRHILGRVGATPQIFAHPGTYVEGQGLRMDSLDDTPFAHPHFGLNKSSVTRHFMATGLPVAYAGDGSPDLEPILMLPPERRFATGWLAEQLAQRGEKFHRFQRWPDLVRPLRDLMALADQTTAEDPTR